MFPMRYVVDAENASESELEAIKASCPYDAVALDDAAKEIDLAVGAIVVATGWKPYDVSKLTNLGGGTLKNVVTNMQFERLCAPNGPTSGKIQRPSDGAEPKKIAFVQCAGSRDQNHLTTVPTFAAWLHSSMFAMSVNVLTPAQRSTTLICVRLVVTTSSSPLPRPMKNSAWSRARSLTLLKTPKANPVVTVENALTGIKTEETFDMVVLATGMEPSCAGLKARPEGLMLTVSSSTAKESLPPVVPSSRLMS